MNTTTTDSYRMACTVLTTGQHRRLYAIPEGARIDRSGVAPWILRDGDLLRCKETGCRRGMRAVLIEGHDRPNIRCGDICRNATGYACRCSCGGRNHGREDWE